jgi:mono/diheme cytochrome c family protein
MLKPFVIVAAVITLLCTCSAGLIPGLQDPGANGKASSDSLARAKEIYKRDCLICHGAGGDGKTEIAKERELVVPDWTDPKSLSGRPDQQLFQIIRFGRGKMPAEAAGRADDAEVRSLILYIRGMSKPAASSAN